MNAKAFGQYCQGGGLILVASAAAVHLGLHAFVVVERRSSRLTCANNLKQIGLAFKTWALDQADAFPFNRNTNEGGTGEYCAVGTDGFDSNAAIHFRVMSNELSSPKVLVCPEDKGRSPAANFNNLQPSNVTYLLRTGPSVSEETPTNILAVCPVDGYVLYCDGSVQQLQEMVQMKYDPRVKPRRILPVYRSTAGIAGLVLLITGTLLKNVQKGNP
jgi:hypothetical protein